MARGAAVYSVWTTQGAACTGLVCETPPSSSDPHHLKDASPQAFLCREPWPRRPGPPAVARIGRARVQSNSPDADRKNRKKHCGTNGCARSKSEGDGVTIGRRGRGTVGGLRGCWARFCLRNHMYNNRLHSFLADRVFSVQAGIERNYEVQNKLCVVSIAKSCSILDIYVYR